MPLLFAIGSGNPAKIACVQTAVRQYWPDAETVSHPAESGVSDQPRTSAEAYEGAVNRARAALAAVPHAHYGVGLEGGTIEDEHGMWASAWIVVVSRDGRIGKGQTARYLLPEAVASLIRDHGMELGAANDLIYGRTNSKHSEGAIGILTHGRIDRAQLYQPAVTMALIPFLPSEPL